MIFSNKILLSLKIVVLSITVSLGGMLATTRSARANEIIITKIDKSNGIITAVIHEKLGHKSQSFKSKQLFTVYKKKLSQNIYEGYINNIFLESQTGNTLQLKEAIIFGIIRSGYYLVPSNVLHLGVANSQSITPPFVSITRKPEDTSNRAKNQDLAKALAKARSEAARAYAKYNAKQRSLSYNTTPFSMSLYSSVNIGYAHIIVGNQKLLGDRGFLEKTSLLSNLNTIENHRLTGAFLNEIDFLICLNNIFTGIMISITPDILYVTNTTDSGDSKVNLSMSASPSILLHNIWSVDIIRNALELLIYAGAGWTIPIDPINYYNFTAAVGTYINIHNILIGIKGNVRGATPEAESYSFIPTTTETRISFMIGYKFF